MFNNVEQHRQNKIDHMLVHMDLKIITNHINIIQKTNVFVMMVFYGLLMQTRQPAVILFLDIFIYHLNFLIFSKLYQYYNQFNHLLMCLMLNHQNFNMICSLFIQFYHYPINKLFEMNALLDPSNTLQDFYQYLHQFLFLMHSNQFFYFQNIQILYYLIIHLLFLINTNYIFIFLLKLIIFYYLLILKYNLILH